MKTIKPKAMHTILEAIRYAVRIAKRRKETVKLKFNGSRYTVKPTSTVGEIYFQFERRTGSYKSYFGKPFPRPVSEVRR